MKDILRSEGLSEDVRSFSLILVGEGDAPSYKSLHLDHKQRKRQKQAQMNGSSPRKGCERESQIQNLRTEEVVV